MFVPFNRLSLSGAEAPYIAQALGEGIAGNGRFTARAQGLLERMLGVPKVMLTHSCTGALEMAGLLGHLQPGDEVIMPSFTFTSTANAVVLRGAVPVFVDIRPDTLNLDERLIEAAITPRTRMILVVHYAGIACAMDEILAIAARHGLMVVEDAAQGLGSSYGGRPLGTFGAIGALSFHETKNITCGEGGALLVNDPALAARAEILWEKGTNRAAFKRGLVDKYTWLDLGSSFLPSDIQAAYLLAQLEACEEITARRRAAWALYHEAIAELEPDMVRRPVIPPGCEGNGHIYYVLAPDRALRDQWIVALNAKGASAVIHYIPLHSAPAGQKFGRAASPLPVTDEMAGRLMRLPMYADLSEDEITHVADALKEVSRATPGRRGRAMPQAAASSTSATPRTIRPMPQI